MSILPGIATVMLYVVMASTGKDEPRFDATIAKNASIQKEVDISFLLHEDLAKCQRLWFSFRRRLCRHEVHETAVLHDVIYNLKSKREADVRAEKADVRAGWCRAADLRSFPESC